MISVTCGVEEPLQPNPQLSSLVEGFGNIGLAMFGCDALCRYSFVPHTEVVSYELLGAVLARLLSALDVNASCVVAFPTESGGSFVRARAQLSRMRKRGWKAVQSGGLCLAGKEIEGASRSGIVPEDADPRIGGSCILWGALPSMEALVESPFAPTFHILAVTHRLYPSSEFLSACSERKIGFAYFANDRRERTGLVVVSSHPLLLTIRALQQEGLVDAVFSGSEAHKVWRL